MESTRPDPDPEPSEGDLWVRTAPSPDGTTYVVAISLGDVAAFTLTPAEAATYATHVIGVCTRAKYDAAVSAQLTAGGLDPADAGQAGMDLRCARPPLEPTTWPWPLGFRGIVSNRSGHPIINLVVEDRPIAQVDVPTVLGHAAGVLEMAQLAPLDHTYHQWLTGTVGVTDLKARQTVQALGAHQPGGPR